LREDCGYCSQSRVSKAEIPKYKLVTPDQILDGRQVGRPATFKNLLHGDFRTFARRSGT